MIVSHVYAGGQIGVGNQILFENTCSDLLTHIESSVESYFCVVGNSFAFG